MPKQYKATNKKTGETIEFDFEGVPTPADIKRIVQERAAKRIIKQPEPPVNLAPPINEPVERPPTFGSQFSRLKDFATTSVFPDAEKDITDWTRSKLGDFPASAVDFAIGGATSPLGLATLGAGAGLAKYASKFRKATPLVDAVEKEMVPATNAMFRSTTDKIAKPKYRMILDEAGKAKGYINASTGEELPAFMQPSGSGTPVLTDAGKAARRTRKVTGFNTNPTIGVGTDLPDLQEMMGAGNKPPINKTPLPEFQAELPKMDQKKGSLFTDVINAPKSLWASYDLSAPLRQGKGLIHKPEFRESIGPMFKSLVSEDAFKSAQSAIKAKPTFNRQVKAGLALGDLEDLTKREEQIMSTITEKIPGVRASNRAYTTFLNKLRSDTFDSLLTSAEKAGGEVDEKAIASFINNATGRGSLGKFEKNAVELNNVFFSPRFISSRLNMLAAPITYMKAPPQIQKEVVKSLIATTAYWATAAGLANEFGDAKIGMDPTSSDFGKIKKGDTRVDTLAGYQQYIRTAYQLLSGEKTSPVTGKTKTLGEGYKAETRKDVLESFVRSKASPVAGTIYDTLKGRTIAGKPIKEEMTRADMDNYFLKMVTPNLIQTARELYKEDPSLFTGFAGAAAIFGESVQVFDEYVAPARRNRYSLSR